jgi:Mg2+-importing ATPase
MHGEGAPREADAGPRGLTSAQARRLLREHGANELHPHPRRSVLADLARRFRSPLIVILLAASAVSAFTGDAASFVIIATVILLSVAIDFVQEHRAGRAAEALIRRVQVHANVLRDGRTVPLPVTRLVPGDVVSLAAGSVIPGDGTLLEANGLHVNEALLTGEPFPVEKRAGDARGERIDLFMGTSVVSGTAVMRLVRTGAATEVGRIARALEAEPPPTSFELGLRAFGMLIMRITAFLVLFVLLVNVALHRPLLESFVFAVALAVGLTPELLPMIVSVTLSRGALRLSREHVIVKRLAAIEGLGSMDVLCTDKTGTLTQARIRLERAVDLDGRESAAVRELGALNSAFQAGIRTPLDEALLAHPPAHRHEWSKLDEVPFDFERRRVAVLLRHGSRRRVLVVKGAPEELLTLCTHYARAGEDGPRELDDGARHRAAAALEAMGAAGLRALAIAHREHHGERAGAHDERGLVLDGFAAFADPAKPGAGEALAALAASGVAVKILTGDGAPVARHLCAALGIEVKGVLTGAEIARLDDAALGARAEAATLFCRVSPAQKTRIVAALKARGRVVGFLGDGINDAPALHAADVGLSVSNAVDVAKEAADLILLKRDLGVVHRGVLEGRGTFVNIRKYVLMGTSSNFGNMFSMAGASLFLPFLPLLPAQILLNNLLYDISEIPIPLDRADAAETARPQEWDMRLVRGFMWVLGPVSSLFDFLTFYVLLAVLHADEALFRTGWFVESLATQVLVIFVIRTRGSALASAPHPALAAVGLAAVALAVALPFTPLAPALGFEAPPPSFLLVLAALVAAYLLLAEIAKRTFYRLALARAA